MEKKTVNKPEVKKYSYEELNNICHQLSQENKALVERLRDTTLNNVFRRLDYLIAIVSNEDKFGNYPEFVEKCKKEIVDLIVIPEQEKTVSPEDNK